MAGGGPAHGGAGASGVAPTVATPTAEMGADDVRPSARPERIGAPTGALGADRDGSATDDGGPGSTPGGFPSGLAPGPNTAQRGQYE